MSYNTGAPNKETDFWFLSFLVLAFICTIAWAIARDPVKEVDTCKAYEGVKVSTLSDAAINKIPDMCNSRMDWGSK